MGTEIQDGESSESPGLGRFAWLALLAVLLMAAVPRVRLVREHSPYPLHEDEALITRRAGRILMTGDLNPHFFKYPSLPIYATAVGLGLGYLWDGGQAKGMEPREVGRTSQPYYEREGVMLATRMLFALLSLLPLFWIGRMGAKAFKEPAMLFLGPLILGLSSRYLMQSWTYINVDLVGTIVCTGALTYCVATWKKDSLLHRAILPGLLTGMAVGSKYYLGLVGLPFAIAIFFHPRKSWLKHTLFIALFTAAGFLISTPYSLLDREHFVEQLVFEINHYSEGHQGAEEEPGLPQLMYYLGRIQDEFGWLNAALCVIGIGYGMKRHRRESILILAFPLALLLFLSTQRVHFIRNLLGLYAIYPVFVALGAVALWRMIGGGHAQRGRSVATAVALFALWLPLQPWARMTRGWRQLEDSRRLALDWVDENAQRGRMVIIASELQMDPRPLKGRYSVLVEPLSKFLRPGMIHKYNGEGLDPLFIVPRIEDDSKWDRFYEPSKRAARKLTERARMGSNGIPLDADILIHMGNPELAILELPRN